MRVNDLGPVEHPDFNNFVIHFTGRLGVDRRSPVVAHNDDLGRMRNIVESRQLLGFDGPGTPGSPSVCLSSRGHGGRLRVAHQAAALHLVRHRVYPWESSGYLCWSHDCRACNPSPDFDCGEDACARCTPEDEKDDD